LSLRRIRCAQKSALPLMKTIATGRESKETKSRPDREQDDATLDP
jgi:hypothetical protein